MNLKKIDNSSIKYYFVFLWQLFWWFVQYIPLRYIFRIKSHEDFILSDIKKPVLIVSNHKTVFDPWFITMSLPLKKYYSLIPIRPIVTQHFSSNFLNLIYKFWIIPFAYYPNGALVLPPKEKNHLYTPKDKLKKTINALQNEYVSILLFPEGGMKKEDKIHDFKPGVAYLIDEKPEGILFVSLRKVGRTYKIRWSKIYKPDKFLFSGEEKEVRMSKITKEAYTIVNNLYSEII
jgi:1-acyl-sn-glycerol-3-phosphate acyltransferase